MVPSLDLNLGTARGKPRVTLTRTFHTHRAAVFKHTCRGITKKLLARGSEMMRRVTQT